MFSIPADARREKSTCAAGQIGFSKGSSDAPIVRNIDLLPSAIIELWLVCIGRVGIQETPVRIERRHGAGKCDIGKAYTQKKNNVAAFSHSVFGVALSETVVDGFSSRRR